VDGRRGFPERLRGSVSNFVRSAKATPVNNSDTNGDYSWGDPGQNLGGQIGGYVAATALARGATAGLGCLVAGVVGGAALGATGGLDQGNLFPAGQLRCSWSVRSSRYPVPVRSSTPPTVTAAVRAGLPGMLGAGTGSAAVEDLADDDRGGDADRADQEQHHDQRPRNPAPRPRGRVRFRRRPRP
jgi:hypothetical protein